jgi:hypothetical protein
MLPGATPFSVSKFIWHDLITSMDNGVHNFPYAPYVMYIIELVTGYIFKKDCEHCSYQVKQWQHQKTEAAVQACVDSAKKSAKKPAAHDEEDGPSRPKKESTLQKMKELIRHSLSMCTYSATQAYEAGKDINRLLSHNGLATQSIPPPPIFFDDFSSSEEEAPETPQHISSEDEEPLSAKLQKMKAKAKPTPRGIRKGVKGTAGRGKRPPSDEDEDLGSEDSSEEWSE